MLALIAGGGGLPRRVAEAQATYPLICGYEGVALEGVRADVTFRLETLGTLLNTLRARGVSRVSFCGSVARPSFDPAALDADTMHLIPLFQKALAAGDDGALRSLVDVFEKAGFDVVAAQDITPSLTAEPGVMSLRHPDEQMSVDAGRAADVCRAMAPLDVGQCCVVGQSQVMGIETIGGTDHMLATLPERARGSNAILFKGPKPQQSRLVDMPTIGPETINAAHQAGLAGVIIVAGQVIVLDPDRCIALANELDLVLWSRSAS